MKRLIYLAAISLLNLNSFGQLELEMDFPLEKISYFFITDSQGVYANYSFFSPSDTILLFNDESQLIRTITTPADSILSIINISKYLYNEDDLYELIYVYMTFAGGTVHYHTHIINENADLLEHLEDMYIWIQNTARGTRLISQKGSRVYHLPGVHYPIHKGPPGERGEPGPKGDPGEPCDPGTKSVPAECDCISGLADLPVLEALVLSEPYPNPSSISSVLDYQLVSPYDRAMLVFYDLTGIRKLSIVLDATFGTLEVHKSLLGKGTYLYRIETEKGTSEIRKLVFE
jgi:hypothetical protein